MDQHTPTTDEMFLLVFCLIDELYNQLVPDHVRYRPGHDRIDFADSEVITLSIMQEALSNDSELSFHRIVGKDYSHLFPKLLERSRYHRRRKALLGVQLHLLRHLMTMLKTLAAWLVVDSAPVETVAFVRSQSGRLWFGQRPNRLASSKEAARLRRFQRGQRALVETVFSMLADQFTAETTRARSLLGLTTRVAAKLLSYNVSYFINQIEILNHQERYEEAIIAYRRVEEIAPLCQLLPAWRTRVALGHLLYYLEQPYHALALWSDVLNAIEKHRGHQLNYETDRTRLIGSFSDLYPLMVEICLSSGQTTDAWHWAERGKNRALLDRMEGNLPPLDKQAETLFTQWQRIRQKIERLTKFQATASPDQQLPSLTEELAALHTDEVRPWAKVIAAMGSAAQFVQVSVPEPEMLARRLQGLFPHRKTLLVEYAMVDEARYAVFLLPLWEIHETTLLPLSTELVDLSADSIDHVQRVFAEAISASQALGNGDAITASGSVNPLEAFEALPTVIGEAFLAPWAHRLNAFEPEALLIVPSGPLHQLPLHVGRLPQTRRRSVAPGPLLAERYQVSYLASVSLIAALGKQDDPAQADRQSPPVPPPNRRLVMGPAQSDLRAALQETAHLAQRWHVRAYTLEAMTKAVLRQHAGRVALVHLATHSHFDAETYLKSQIQAVANPDGRCATAPRNYRAWCGRWQPEEHKPYWLASGASTTGRAK